MLKRKISVIIICLVCVVHIFQVDKVEAKMLMRKELEPTGYVTWEVPNNEKIIAITFDDGPDPTYTPQVLELLHQYKAEATFFMIGFRVQRNPYLVKQVLKEGHEIGNHTMNHLYARSASDERLKDDILAGKKYLQKWVKEPLLFRPPGGYINDAVFTTAKEAGYQTVLWSWHQDPKDWANPGTESIVNHVVKNAKSGDIVLLHDGGNDRSQTVAALEKILSALQKEGYRFVKVSELLRYKH
ncbi:polysaccharide deacetylase family sporulation protein PdaB [Bacillus pseudomycoides]|uniref:polysaccharide deacetylase family sporulation protein PdaB n=1 Tax=Bacillus pseudomycoides TaxID=64104 RepID=UPI000BEC5EEF|nr:polysaccharide deacetylase family sporulation protein PdaB [Bacillus pseudomycoides]PEE40578.1 polysaccharide deacetylase family sporulation protein PdaB [Bacillus pseudomycoides]PEI92704.1 polysaccharide deacetylase family sporulation protein PdaB [Bacillus pseudomycoides]PGA90809.1 polysaccharide deacetylase family sporulation protein PdaB [Bacillus pseudomycoides]PHF50743.1 polysaccharide deacetylase family sporulation protein PdaB [Bacillus pseudomycoides]